VALDGGNTTLSVSGTTDAGDSSPVLADRSISASGDVVVKETALPVLTKSPTYAPTQSPTLYRIASPTGAPTTRSRRSLVLAPFTLVSVYSRLARRVGSP
jgi:hypothetical protein